MGIFKATRKGISLSRRKKAHTGPRKKRIFFTPSPMHSPFSKRIKVSATPSHDVIPFRMLIEILKDMGQFEDTKQRALFHEDTDTDGNKSKTDFSHIDDVILKELECSHFLPDEVDPDEDETDSTDQITKMLPAVIEQFKANGKINVLEDFFRLVSEQKFPFENTAFLLWCDLVTLLILLGRPKLFGGRFIRFMTGMKNEESILKGNVACDLCESRLNFVCPNEKVLRSINPVGNDIPLAQKPGILESMIKFKAEKDDGMNSYVLMLDGKKIKKGTNVDLLGFEKDKTLKDRIEERDITLKSLELCIDAVSKAQEKRSLICETDHSDACLIHAHLRNAVLLFSKISQDLQNLRVKKKLALDKLRKMAGQEWRKSKYAFSIDLCLTSIWKIDNLVDKILGVIRCICKTGAHLNRVGHLFTNRDVVDLCQQENVKLLKEPENLPDS